MSSRADRRPMKIGIIITVISGVILGAYTATTWNYEKAEGVCITAHHGKNSYNLYEFTVDGNTYTYHDSCSTNDKTKIGDTTTVRYDPDDPNKTFDSDVMILADIALGIGLLFTCTGIKWYRDDDRVIWDKNDPAQKYMEKRK